MKAKNGKWLGVLALSLMIPLSGFSAEGGNSGGGGDASEARVNEIRSDILSWIGKGGAQNLKLPKDMSYGQYEDAMKDILAPKKVIIGFVEKDDAQNPELQVSVNGIPKTCRGFISKKDKAPHILCSIPRFKETKDGDQYRLIHHEYAGLARLEKNEGASSDYEISNQLTDYLTYQKVLRLAVKTPDVSVDRPGLGTAVLVLPKFLKAQDSKLYISLMKCPEIPEKKLPCKDIDKDLKGMNIDSYNPIETLTLRPGKYTMYVYFFNTKNGEGIKTFESIDFKLADREIKRLEMAEVKTQQITGPGSVKIHYYKKDFLKENLEYLKNVGIGAGFKTCIISESKDPLETNKNFCARLTKILRIAQDSADSDNVRRMAMSILDSGKITIDQHVKLLMVLESQYQYSGITTSDQKILKRAEALEFLKENNEYVALEPLDNRDEYKDKFILSKVEYAYFDFAYYIVDPGTSVLLPNGEYIARYVNESGDEWTQEFTVNGQEIINLE